jgi:ferredoxin
MAEFASTRTRRRAAIVAAGAMHLVLLLSLLLATPTAHSFALSSQSRSSPSSSRTTTMTTTTTTTSLHIFGGLKGAFSNDDSLGKAKDAGLSSGPRYNDQVSVNGKMIPKVVIDQKVSLVCNAARVKVPYNCQNGECGTCTVRMNGKPVRACVAKVPSGKCSIVTL